MVLWDFAVHTDKKIDVNRPDIIIQHFKEQACPMLSATVPAERIDKLSKYKDLE